MQITIVMHFPANKCIELHDWLPIKVAFNDAVRVAITDKDASNEMLVYKKLSKGAYIENQEVKEDEDNVQYQAKQVLQSPHDGLGIFELGRKISAFPVAKSSQHHTLHN